MARLDADPERHNDPLYRRRHSLAHVLAQAVLELRPGSKLGFGPPVDTGFYYDFLFEAPLEERELAEIERRMRRILKRGVRFEREELTVADAVRRLDEIEQPFKVEYARDLESTLGVEQISFYRSGDFIDMCEGPHVESTREIPRDSFRLDSLAGAYWRGDERNPMMTRIYGLAFESKAALEEFVRKRELARERDHRKLGAELEIFAISDEIGRGLPLWLPNGTVLRDELEQLAREEEFRAGYQRVSTPHIAKADLYRTSGHLPYYTESMYPPMQLDDEEAYYLKPMNCPHHHTIFAARPRSYRELPLRLAEYGDVYRYEKSGQLAGLLRVRGMRMNDAHIYCTLEQAREEFAAVIDMHKKYYDMFRLTEFWMRLSLHSPDQEKFVTAEERWVFAEQLVREVLAQMQVPFEERVGEAAFYGPKVDYQVTNVVGREETASTGQLDFIASERFNLEYVARDGSRQRPWIIHRAPLGTHERFVSFLLEHFGGFFPTWLAPLQVVLIPVSMGERFVEYGRKLQRVLHDDLLRARFDDSPDSFGKKIRNAETHKVPNLFILGQKEIDSGAVTWRRHGQREHQPFLPFTAAHQALRTLRERRLMDNFEDVDVPAWSGGDA
ncbi:MAG: threonine--tRNA ligase [Candidatus Latescibacterota bacterium]|nr:MAG: threonine--tRNA ligase [Candidatus Latescibacterota bacterium]